MRSILGTQPRGDLRARGLLLIGILAAGAGLMIPDPHVRQTEISLGVGIFALISAWTCARRGSQAAEGTATGLLPSPWGWLASAMVFQALAHLVLLAGLFGLGRVQALATLSTLLSLAAFPALFLGLLMWPHPRVGPGRRRRTTLDAFLFGGSLLFILWQLGLRDLANAAPGEMALYLILPFVLVCLDFGYWAYLVMPAAALPRGPLGFLGLTLGGAFFVNLAAMLAGLGGSYGPGHWSDALSIPVMALPALAAWSPLPAAFPADTAEPEERPGRLQLILPFIPAAAGLGVVLVQLGLARHRLDWQTVGFAAFIVAGLFLRQFLTLWDLEKLSRSLETRVQERTRELTHAQDVMVRTERMNAMATLGAGLAHDLKNLIGVVRNYALLVHRDLQEGRPAEMEDMEAIQLASGQAVHLANQLMNYGRSEEEENETFDLTLQLRQLETMLRAILPPEIALVTDFPERSLMLRENPFHIDQMVVNLVLNAQDALVEGGVIRLTAVEDQLENGKPAVRLEVADNGTGITESVKARLFEPFFTTKTSGKGTGIGLASVKEAIRGFGGSIKVESEPGVGSRFIILLPLA